MEKIWDKVLNQMQIAFQSMHPKMPKMRICQQKILKLLPIKRLTPIKSRF